MNGTIRPMSAADRAAVLDMMRAFYASPAVLSDGSDEIFTNDIRACLGGSPYLEGYVFADGEAVMGYAMLARSFSTEFGKPCVWIEDLYVKPAFRGMGLGKRFLDFAARKYEGCVFRLEAEPENEGAVRLYEKSGFSVLPYMEMKK